MARFPYEYVRYVPRFAGLDVAASVTVYQVASSAHAAVVAVSRGHAAARDITGRVSRAVQRTTTEAKNLGAQGANLAIGATSGAIHAAAQSGLGLEYAARQSVAGVLNALAKTNANPMDVLWGAGYASVQSAKSLGEDLGKMAARAVEGAVAQARTLGVSESEAASATARGAMQAAREMGPSAVEDLSQELLDSLIEVDEHDEPGPG